MSDSPHIPYEYRRGYNPNSYLLHEESIEGHKFGYSKRRRVGTRLFTGFKPTCSCKFKFEVWFHTKEMALHSFNGHVREVKKQLQFDIV